ncbi:MAG: molybdate ABC transporter substrate-binding protein [Thermoanaerobaculia bacterium]
MLSAPTRRLLAGLVLGGAGAGFLTGCAVASEEPLLVFAAASLADALEEVGEAWEAEHPGQPVAFNFAGSNDLARQVAAGAPADLFVAADRERLVRSRRADVEGAVPLLGNALVVIAPRMEETPGIERLRIGVREPEDLLVFDRIGLADPEAVPAGVYAREWLERSGVWYELRDRVVPAVDVRANLAAVASESVPVGVVYATDAATSDRVEVLYRVPPPEAPEIVYWAAVVGDEADGKPGPEGGGETQESSGTAAERFLRFLAGSQAGEVFRGHGFRHLPEGVPAVEPGPGDGPAAGSREAGSSGGEPSGGGAAGG